LVVTHGSAAAFLLACVLTNSEARAIMVFSDSFSGGSTVPITTAPNNAYPATTARSQFDERQFDHRFG
jgi:hypothetical protein